jgi:hypothetical protein
LCPKIVHVCIFWLLRATLKVALPRAAFEAVARGTFWVILITFVPQVRSFLHFFGCFGRALKVALPRATFEAGAQATFLAILITFMPQVCSFVAFLWLLRAALKVALPRATF